MLESDLSNPDSRLHVVFRRDTIQNNFRSAQEGRPVFDEFDFIRISVPGDTTTVIDRIANEDDKARFPLHWAHYQNTRGEGELAGTPLTSWAILSKSQVEELRALKFMTVESIATASDSQLQRIGMIAGMAPHAFRDRAMRYLKAAEDESYVNQQAEIAKNLQDQNKAMAAQMEEMQKVIAELAANQKQKPGRKAAQPEEPESNHEAA